jgi:6-pyruvoyltetrahydropterin/6-carboxytetrahydropterin synthase
MNYTVAVIRTFSAAHALRGYKGRCEHLHGHNWKVRVAVAGKRLNETGMIVDFTDLKAWVDAEIAVLDHNFLNEVSPFTRLNPTAEQIAGFIFGRIKKKLPAGVQMAGVEVWESDTSSARVTR